MSGKSAESLLTRLTNGSESSEENPWAAVAARVPDHERPKPKRAQIEKERQQKLDHLLAESPS